MRSKQVTAFLMTVGVLAGLQQGIAGASGHVNCSWQAYLFQPVGALSTNITAVDAYSDTDAWGVGTYYNGNGAQALAEHWDGSHWQQVVMPSPVRFSGFTGVTVISPSDVWAVGSRITQLHRRYVDQAIVTEHWNGANWSIVKARVAPRGVRFNLSDLLAVSGTASDDVWAVGAYRRRFEDPTRTLIEHWNGRRWIASADLPGTGFWLYGVTAVSPTDVWAFGNDSDGAAVMHFNGTRWHLSHPFVANSALVDGASSSRGNVWTVGYTPDNQMPNGRELIARRHANSWTVVPDYPLAPRVTLVATSGADSTLVAATLGSPNDPDYVSYWNGITWTSWEFWQIDDLAAVPGSSQMWVVGYDTSGTARSALLICS